MATTPLVNLSPFAGAGAQFFDNNGVPLFGGLLYTYASGTTTPQATYTTPQATVQNSNPIVLDSSGRTTQEIWLLNGYSYKFVLQNASATQIGSYDNIPSTSTNSAIINDAVSVAYEQGYSVTAGSFVVGNSYLITFVGTTNFTSIGASSNTVGVYFVATGVGSGTGTATLSRTVQSKLQEIVSVKDFGATGNGTTDDTVAIQAAIDAVCPTVGSGFSAGAVYFPAGNYLISSTLNCTNSRTSNTKSRDGLMLFGAGEGSVIIGQTNTGYAMIETTGSQWLTIRDLHLSAGSTNPSTVGIYQGLSSTLPETQNQKFEKLIIGMGDNSSVNNGQGTIGIWNFGAEENTYDTCYVTANLPYVFTAYATSPNLGISYAHSYQTLATSHSCGVNTLIGENFMVSLNFVNACLVTEDVNSLNLENVFMSNTGGTSGSNTYAWKVFGSCSGTNGNGTIEAYGTALYIIGALSAAEFRFTFGSISNTSAPRIAINPVNSSGVIVNSNISFYDNVSSARPLVNFISGYPTTPDQIVGSYIANTTFKTNVNASGNTYLALPENLKFNVNTGNVEIFGFYGGKSYKYQINYQRDNIDIPPIVCLQPGSISSAEICRVQMPTVYGSNNATSVSVRIRGNLSIKSNGTNSMSTKYIDAQISMSSNYSTGTVYFGAGSTTGTADQLVTTTPASVAPSGNNITAGAITASVSSNVVSLVMTATLAGANQETVQFNGNVEMIWANNIARAPSLLIG